MLYLPCHLGGLSCLIQGEEIPCSNPSPTFHGQKVSNIWPPFGLATDGAIQLSKKAPFWSQAN